MSASAFCLLPSRALLRAGGEAAHNFLQSLVTCDLEQVDETGVGFGALLTPQGKIFFDFLILRHETAYLIDAPAEIAADLLKRLTFYRLRAKVELEALENWSVAVSFGGEPLAPNALLNVTDPRLTDLGQRHYGPSDMLPSALQTTGATAADASAYQAHRISLGVPESMTDYAYSDIFPHDADMDQLQGVSFTKGCYVGQEVVSRMQHRGTARKRMIRITGASELPETGSPILADGKSVGELRSSAGSEGIALVRLDKAQAARSKGQAFTCQEATVELVLPSWAKFDWPDGPESA
ncbi:YgfZ/GcvT domain-containing protein [Roseibium sp.]|uniref:CAF17-like 4Fe-4S cluster assembly/insertion protein YgfZ n=1 Tax=Roseibium sp. TaxID=1936156 RepID=UPI003A96F18C